MKIPFSVIWSIGSSWFCFQLLALRQSTPCRMFPIKSILFVILYVPPDKRSLAALPKKYVIQNEVRDLLNCWRSLTPFGMTAFLSDVCPKGAGLFGMTWWEVTKIQALA